MYGVGRCMCARWQCGVGGEGADPLAYGLRPMVRSVPSL